MRPITVTVGPLASPSATAICLAQQPAAGDPFLLNGATVVNGIAVLDQQRRVLFTFVGDESANTFTITGTNWAGDIISEVVTGVNAGTATTVLDYYTVTSIVIENTADDDISVGTNTVAGSKWVRLDEWSLPQTSIQVTADGTVDFTVQQTLEDPNSPWSPVPPQDLAWVDHPDTALVGATGTVQGNYAYVPAFTRVILNSGTGSIRATFTQSGVVSR